jgi:anti-anti-sigma factor
VGEFDLAQRDRLADAFAVAGGSDRVVVDLGDASYIDSTVLSELINLRTELAKRSRTLVLVRANGSVRRLLDVSQLGALFEVRAQLEDAIDQDEPAQRIVLVATDDRV